MTRSQCCFGIPGALVPPMPLALLDPIVLAAEVLVHLLATHIPLDAMAAVLVRMVVRERVAQYLLEGVRVGVLDFPEDGCLEPCS